LEKIMNLASVSVASHAALFAEASAQSHHNLGTVSIDDCGTVVPHKIPGGGNPPPPPPFGSVAQFAGNAMSVAFTEDGPRCGNEPRKWPFPPPPPLPLVGDFSQSIS
jgi:hypothetical protein